MNVILSQKQKLKVARLRKPVGQLKKKRTSKPSRHKPPIRPRQRMGRTYHAEITIKATIKVCN